MRRKSCLWLSNTTFCWYALPRGLSGNLRVNKMPVCGITVRQPGALGSQSRHEKLVLAQKVGPRTQSQFTKSSQPTSQSCATSPSRPTSLANTRATEQKPKLDAQHAAHMLGCSSAAVHSAEGCRHKTLTSALSLGGGRPGLSTRHPPLPRSARVHTHRPPSGADKRLQQHTPMCARQSGQHSNELRPNEWRVPKHCTARV